MTHYCPKCGGIFRDGACLGCSAKEEKKESISLAESELGTIARYLLSIRRMMVFFVILAILALLNALIRGCGDILKSTGG